MVVVQVPQLVCQIIVYYKINSESYTGVDSLDWITLSAMIVGIIEVITMIVDVSLWSMASGNWTRNVYETVDLINYKFPGVEMVDYGNKGTVSSFRPGDIIDENQSDSIINY